MYLTIQETAARTKISTSSIKRLVTRKNFPQPVTLIGRKKVWSEAEVTSWMQEKIAPKKGLFGYV